MSLNVISLSGLILAVGMMIDSAIIVTENISQYRERGYSLKRSCAVGTTEMITPMLSSSLTTIAVFVPLIFYEWHSRSYFYGSGFFYHGGIDDILYYGYYVAARIVSVVFIRSVSAVRDFFPDVLTIC